jgi:lysosomal acid phosphatase
MFIILQNGKRQVYAQGEWLRAHYGEFVGNDYASVYTQSTDVDRSLMTAQLVLAAMFPPTPYQEVVPGLKWQPIPVHTTPLKNDNVRIWFIQRWSKILMIIKLIF